MRVKVSKWGNSTAVRLPREVVEELRLSPGDEVDVTVRGGRVEVAPAKRFPTFAEMVDEMKRLGPQTAHETIRWGPDVGSEIIDDEYSRGEIVFNEETGEYEDRPRRG